MQLQTTENPSNKRLFGFEVFSENGSHGFTAQVALLSEIPRPQAKYGIPDDIGVSLNGRNDYTWSSRAKGGFVVEFSISLLHDELARFSTHFRRGNLLL
jgi:hypothetical protein